MDLDSDALDLRRLKRLSRAMHLEVRLEAWRSRIDSKSE
jgi:hypothetical protein